MINWIKRFFGFLPPPPPPTIWEVASSHYHDVTVLLSSGWEPFAVYVEADFSGARPLYYFKRKKPS